MQYAEQSTGNLSVTTILVGFICFLVGFFLGIVVLISAQVREVQSKQRELTNMELLGRTTTVVDPNDPLVKQLKADDDANGRTPS